MPIRITCANESCRKGLRLGDEHAGKRVKCPACGHPQVVPASTIAGAAAQEILRRLTGRAPAVLAPDPGGGEVHEAETAGVVSTPAAREPEKPPEKSGGHAESVQSAGGPLDTKTLAALAAHRRWKCADLAEDRERGYRTCARCETRVKAGAGYLIEPVLYFPRNRNISPEAEQINGGLNTVWRAFGLSTAHCHRCGIILPVGTTSSGGLGAGLDSMVGLHTVPAQGVVAALKVCEAWFGGDEKFVAPSDMLLLSKAILSFTRMQKCLRCQSYTCRRCHQPPGQPVRPAACALCWDVPASGLPVLVCEACFGKQKQDSVYLHVLAALWSQRTDLLPLAEPAAVTALLGSLDSPEADIAGTAERTLGSLTDPEMVDALCARWVATRDLRLAKILRDHGLVARKPRQVRVLTALLVGKGEVITATEDLRLLEPLLAALRGGDRELVQAAGEVLRAWVQRPIVQNEVYRLVLEENDPATQVALVAARYCPAEPEQQPLFFFLTRQWTRYEKADAAGEHLRAAIPIVSGKVRARLAQVAREEGRLEWVQAVLGGPDWPRVGRLSEKEWSAVIELLAGHDHAPVMWSLARQGPGRQSARLLQRLQPADWQPPDVAPGTWKELRRRAEGWPADLADVQPTCRATLDLKGGGLRCLTFGPGGRRVIAAGSDKKIRSWSLAGPDLEATLSGHTGRIDALAVAPDGALLASGGRDNTVRLWSLPDGELQATLKGHNGGITCLAISPDGRLLASGSCYQTMRLWSLPEGRRLGVLSGHGAAVECLAITPDGKLLASGSADYTVRLWSLPRGEAAAVLKGHGGAVQCLSLSRDGKLLATGSADGTARLWSLPDGQPLATLAGHRKAITCAALTPDGRLLATGSADRTVRLWSVPQRRLTATLQGHGGGVRCLAITPGGQLLASGGADETIRLWSLPGGKHLATLDAEGSVHCLAVSPDSWLLACGGKEAEGINLWDLDAAYLAAIADKLISQVRAKDLVRLRQIVTAAGASSDQGQAAGFLLALAQFLQGKPIEPERRGLFRRLFGGK